MATWQPWVGHSAATSIAPTVTYADGDSFASPRLVYIPTDGGTYQSDSIDGNYLSRETNEPAAIGQMSHTCWWSYTPTSSGTCTMDTQLTTGDTVLVVYTGSAYGALTLVASDDEAGGSSTSRLTFSATAGTTYRIQVGGYDAASIANLTLRVVGPAAGSPPPVYNPGGLSASALDGYVIADCGELRGEWPTYAPTVLPSEAERVGILVCLPPPSGLLDDVLNLSYPTPYVWAERWGSAPVATTGEYAALASGGWTGSLDDPPPGLHVYALWQQSSAGTIHLADGNSFASPRRVYIPNAGDARSGLQFEGWPGSRYKSDRVDGAFLTTEPNEPVPSASGGARHTCWWTYTPNASGTCTMSLVWVSTNSDTVLAVYTGTSISGLTEVASHASWLTFSATAGTTYRIQAGSYSEDYPVARLVLRVLGPATGGTPPPTYFTGSIGHDPVAPTLDPLQLVPQGMVAGSTGPARGGRKDGHWLDWQPRAERSFTVIPDNGGFASNFTPGAIVGRRVLDYNFREEGYSWGHQFLVDNLEARRQTLTSPGFIDLGTGGYGGGDPNQSSHFSQTTYYTFRSATIQNPNDPAGSPLTVNGLEFNASYTGLRTYYSDTNNGPVPGRWPPPGHEGWTFTRLSMAGVSYRGSQWRTGCLGDVTQDLVYGVDYLPPPGPVPPDHQSGYTYYEADHGDFVRWEPHEVNVASIGGSTRTELGAPVDQQVPGASGGLVWNTLYPNSATVPYVPLQSLTLRFAKIGYQFLPGTSDIKLPWKPYGDGTTIQTLGLGYAESTTPITISYIESVGNEGNPKPATGYLQRLSTTLDFGADVEDLTVVMQLSQEGPDLFPIPDQLDFRPLTTYDSSATVGSYNARVVAADGMPTTFASMDGRVVWDNDTSTYNWNPPSAEKLATRPNPFPQVTYNLPRWRYWMPGPIPAYIPLLTGSRLHTVGGHFRSVGGAQINMMQQPGLGPWLPIEDL